MNPATRQTTLEKFRKLMEEWDIKPTDPRDQNLYVTHHSEYYQANERGSIEERWSKKWVDGEYKCEKELDEMPTLIDCNDDDTPSMYSLDEFTQNLRDVLGVRGPLDDDDLELLYAFRQCRQQFDIILGSVDFRILAEVWAYALADRADLLKQDPTGILYKEVILKRAEEAKESL